MCDRGSTEPSRSGDATAPLHSGAELHSTWPAIKPSRIGMVIGMATKKITVTLDQGDVERIRALVESGTAPSVSGFVQHAVGVALDDVTGWGGLLAEALRKTGGPLSDEERDWGDGILGVEKGRGKS